MPYAINYRSDNGSADKLRELWRECASLEEYPSMESMLYPPHITLAIYDEISTQDLFAGFGAAKGHLGNMTIRFESLGYFEAPFGIVLWAAPILPEPVLEAHASIHSAIHPNLCRKNYRPDHWTPHCSLATAISAQYSEEAIAIANCSIDPFDVRFDAVDCASFMPVKILSESCF